MCAATPHSSHSILSRCAADDATGSVKAASSSCAARAPCGWVNSTGILRGQKTVGISHNGSTCRLRAAPLEKLILTSNFHHGSIPGPLGSLGRFTSHRLSAKSSNQAFFEAASLPRQLRSIDLKKPTPSRLFT